MLDILKLFVIAGWLQLQLVSIKAEGFVPVVPSECEALGYCDQTLPDYPVEHVDQLIKENGLVSPGVVDVTKETRRQDPSEVQLCDFTKKTILPQVARDTSGKWKYIVNLPHNTFQQQFLVEICRNENSACSPVFHPPIGYTASCQQKFISKALVALDDQGQKVEENFTIPSSCYCQVKQTM